MNRREFLGKLAGFGVGVALLPILNQGQPQDEYVDFEIGDYLGRDDKIDPDLDTLALEIDGTIYVGGTFTTYGTGDSVYLSKFDGARSVWE